MGNQFLAPIRGWLELGWISYGLDDLHRELCTGGDLREVLWIYNRDGLCERTDGEQGERYRRRELHRNLTEREGVVDSGGGGSD